MKLDNPDDRLTIEKQGSKTILVCPTCDPCSKYNILPFYVQV